MSSGRIFWLTGLAGVGKSTLAQRLCAYLKRMGEQTVLLDGDDLREVYALPSTYDFEGRLATGMRHARMSRLIAEQGITVVCATISMVHEIHDWNRSNHMEYIEILVECDEETRLMRLADRAQCESIKKSQMVGYGVEAQWPVDPHVILDNSSQNGTDEVFEQLLLAIS